jgi:hypothetical protein
MMKYATFEDAQPWLLVSIMCIVVWLFIGCNQPSPYVSPPVSQPVGAYHEVRIDPNTGQQVVYVQQADGTNYFLDYLLFNQLFNSGGYGSVYGYYNTHTVYVRSYQNRYINYRQSTRYYGHTQDKAFRPSAPNRSAPNASAPVRTSSPPRASAPSRVSAPTRSSAPSRSSYSGGSRHR